MIKQVIAVAAILMATVYGSGDGTTTTTPADGGQGTPEAQPVVTNPGVEGATPTAPTVDSTNPQSDDK